MDGNKQRPRGDFNMQSDAPNSQSLSTPLRAAVARPENQEFNVAGQDFGGLPLDKAVKDAIKSGKKAPEPVNEALENLEHHVDVPLKKPTQTVFSSMGGGRNASSTEIGWGGTKGGKPKDNTPKNFVYRDEDFPPPTSASDFSLSVLSASKPKESTSSPSKSAASNNKKSAPIAELHGTKAAPYLGLNHLFFRKGPAKKGDKLSANGTLEMNLGSIFPENRSSSQPKKDSSSPMNSTFNRQDTPEMNLNSLFSEDQFPSQHKMNVLPPLKTTFNRQDTPEMNLNTLFPEDQSLSQSKKNAWSPLKSTVTRQDTPEMGLDKLFPEDSSSGKAPISAQHAQSHEPFNAPAHQVHHSSKHFAAGRSSPEMNLGSLFSEDQSPPQPKKKVSSPLKNTPTRQDTPEMNLNNLFLEERLHSQSTKYILSPLKNTPTRKETPEMNLGNLFNDLTVPTTKLLPGHAHSVPAHRPKKDTDKPDEDAQYDDPSDHHQHMSQPHQPHSFVQQQQKKASPPLRVSLARQDTPEMNLGSLFPEEQSTSQPMKKSSSPLKTTPTRQDTPEMNLNTLFLEDQSSYQLKKSALSPLKNISKRLENPEMNLNQIFQDDVPTSSVHVSHGIAQLASGDSTQPVSISIADLLDDSDASDHSPYDSPMETKPMPFTHTGSHAHLEEMDAHAPESSAAGKAKFTTMPHLPDIPSVSMPFFGAKKAGMSTQPEIHPASAPGLPSNKSPWIGVLDVLSGSAPSVSIPELPTLDSPSVGAPEHPSLSASTLPAASIVELPSHSARGHHTAAAPRVGGIRGMMPAMPSMSSSSRHPALYPEEEAGFPRGGAPRHENSAPSHVEHVVVIQKAPVKSQHAYIFRADLPSGEKKLGKRARKAQRKHDATRQHSIMDTISTALIGRKKYTVSSPIMRLNELFDEPTAMALPASAHDAPLLGGIRGMLPGMPTMPTLSSVHLPSMSAMPAVPEVHLPALPEMHLPSLPAMPILALPHLPKIGSAAASSVSGPATLALRKPSFAAALKVPKIDPTLLPEEQADYPRGDIRRHENPVPSHDHVKDVVEVKKLSLPQASPSLSVLPPLRLSSLPKMGVAAVSSVSAAAILPKHKPSTSAALKSPKVDLTLLPEEQANYPRGDVRRHENPAPSHVEDIIEVKKLRLSPALPLMPALPILALDRQQKLGAVTAHRVSGPSALPKHKPSKAAAIKMPKFDLTLFPEEQANYSRGDIPRRENPAPSHVEDIVEVKKLRVPAPLPLDAELPVVMAAAPAFASSSTHMPTLPKIVIPDAKSLAEEEENYYSADDEPATPVVTHKAVVTEPARVIPKIAAPVALAASIIAHRTTVVNEPVTRVIPKVAEIVPVVTQKTVVTETTHVVPEVKKIPIAQPPVEVKKIHVQQPPVEIKKVPIAQPSVETKKIPIAQPPVVTKTTVKTTVKTTTTTAPSVPKIEVAKPAAVQEVKEIKVMTAPKPEPNVRKPSAAELYANEHRHKEILEPKVDDYNLAEKLAHAPRPVIPVVIETKKVIVETTHAPKIVEAPKVVELHKVAEAPKIVKAVSPGPIPAPRPEPIVTKTTVTTTKAVDPIPAPRPIVAAAAIVPAVLHRHHHKDVTPVQMEETKQETTNVTKTSVVEPIPQPVQQVKKVVEEVRHEPIPQPIQQVQTIKAVEEHHHQPQIQQQQAIHQQSVTTTPAAVETLFDSGERTILVKKLYTTTEYYDSEDDDELDEFGYRKDRDVSLHIVPMPTAETRRNSHQAYKDRKKAGVSGLDAEIAALQRQEAANGSRKSSLREPLKQQHPHFWEQTKQVPQGANQQAYVTQIPLQDPCQQQKQEYQVVQENVYTTQPRGQQQQQTQHIHNHQQQQHNSQSHARQQHQRQQYKQQQNKNQQLPQLFQQQHSSQSQPIYQPQRAYQQLQKQQQENMQMPYQRQPGVRVGSEYNRSAAQ